MTRPVVAGAIALLVLAFGLGALLAGRPQAAMAQQAPAANGEKPGEPELTPDARALLQRPQVVAAVPFQSRTEYEQDPFEPTRLRRTQTTVTKLVLIRSDGTTELKDPQ
jgi:hypothetical protein